MPLTAAEVRATKFSTTRMRAGYDMDEVDAFLDIVEADVSQYVDDLQRSRDGEAVLRTQCDQLQVRLGMAEQKLADAQAELVELQALRAHQTEPIATPAPAVASPAPEPEPEAGQAAPDLTPEAASAVAADPEASSVIAIAQQQADQIVRFAQTRADAIRASVRTMLTDQMAMVDRK
jgi:DivIVA domain-containing protein